MWCLHDPANVQQTSSKCIQNTRANAGRLLDRVNTLLGCNAILCGCLVDVARCIINTRVKRLSHLLPLRHCLHSARTPTNTTST